MPNGTGQEFDRSDHSARQQIEALRLEVEYLKDRNRKIEELLDDRLVKLPTDLQSCPAFVVIEGSPAFEALVRVCVRSGGLKAGSIHPIRRSEFESFKTDVIAVHLETETA